MNILIDYTQIPLQRAGVGIYAYNLVAELAKLDANNRYFLLVQDDDPSLDKIVGENFTILKIRATVFRRFFLRVLLEQLYIPWIAYTHKIDIVHSLHYSFPLICPAKKVVTICDMTFFLFPELHKTIKVFFFRLFICLSSIWADRVICISEATRKDYLERFGGAVGKSLTVSLGKGKEFVPDVAMSLITEVKRKYHIAGDYILFIGTIEPRKNIANLLRAFHLLLLDGTDMQLVITGKKGWHYDEVFRLVEELHLADKVIFTGYINENEKPLLLNGATIFTYPSRYEGFGIPVLEAMACGVPTVTSNISSMPEVAGQAAVLVNPDAPNEMFEAIRHLLLNPAEQKAFRDKGLAQAAKFSWARTARETLAVYQENY